MKPHGPWKIKKRQVKYKNPWVKVYEDQVLRPDGKEGTHVFFDLKKGSAVLPIDEEGNVYLTKEFHYGVGRETIEVVAGGLESGETPLQTAKRELQEELGISAKEWIDLGRVYRFTTYMDNPSWLFLARKLTLTKQKLDASETVKVMKVKFEEALQMVMDGRIDNSMSVILILKAARYLQQEQQKH